MMLGSRQDIPWFQSDFYRYYYRKLLRCLVFLTFVMFILIAVLIYLVLFEPEATYYANTVDGKMLLMKPLN